MQDRGIMAVKTEEERSELVKYNDVGTIIGWNDDDETHDEHMVRYATMVEKSKNPREKPTTNGIGRGWWTILAKEPKAAPNNTIEIIHCE